MKQVFVASTPSSITAATFLHAEDTNVETGFFHDADGVSSDLFVAFVKRSSATCEVDVFGRFCDLHVKALGPVAALVSGQAVGVGVGLEVFDGGHERQDRCFNALVKLHALHHEVTTSVGEFGHVVDVNGAGLNASMAGRASPNGALSEAGDDVLFGCFVGQQRRGVVVGVVAHIVNDLHGVEVLAAGVSRANILAASTRRAGPTVDEVSPGEIRVVDGAKRLHVEIVEQDGLAVVPAGQRLHRGHGAKVVEEHVGEGHHQVHVLGKRDEEQENTDGQHVGPVSGDDDAGGGCQRCVNPVADGFPRGRDGGFTGFNHKGGGGDGHDEQQNDVALELGLALELLGREDHTADERQHAPDKSDGVANLNHEVPWSTHDFREHFLRELVAAGEVKHVGREHQEAPEHEHVDAPCNAVLEHLFLAEPSGDHLRNSGTPVVKTVLRFALQDEFAGLPNLKAEKAT